MKTIKNFEELNGQQSTRKVFDDFTITHADVNETNPSVFVVKLSGHYNEATLESLDRSHIFYQLNNLYGFELKYEPVKLKKITTFSELKIAIDDIIRDNEEIKSIKIRFNGAISFEVIKDTNEFYYTQEEISSLEDFGYELVVEND